MSGEVDLTHGFLFPEGSEEQVVTFGQLNKLVTDLVLRVMANAITARELADGSITADKLDADISAQLGIPDGSITTAKLVDKSVTNAKLADMPALTVKARPVNSAGQPQDLQATVDGHVLQRSGNTLVFGPVPASALGNAVTGIAANGRILSGRQFITIFAGTHNFGFVINFASVFASPPVVVATPEWPNGVPATQVACQVQAVSAAQAGIYTYQESSSTTRSYWVHWIAFGVTA